MFADKPTEALWLPHEPLGNFSCAVYMNKGWRSEQCSKLHKTLCLIGKPNLVYIL